MITFSVQDELLRFAGACLLGIPSGLLFDAMRLLRRLIRHNGIAVAAEDLLWVLSVCLMLLMYASAFTEGVFRGYYAIGCLLGFAVYECLFGQPVMRLLTAILHRMAVPMRTIVQRFVLICKKISMRFVKVSEKKEKGKDFYQNRLQRSMKMVYNKQRGIKEGKANGRQRKKP